jgi:superfamily II DNA or RNA helicase
MSEWLREWQQRALITYEERGRPQDFTVVATPGSGKTMFAAELASRLLRDRTIVRIVVVCPTVLLCYQWQKVLSAMGIELQVYDNDMRPEAADFHGMICTYAQFNERWVLTHRGFCSRRPTLVIFDEIHHAGQELSWGNNIKIAFEPAAKRLMMSGTPWRNDNNPIPFVTYDEEGKSHDDFTYSYADGLTDGICRPIFFPVNDGRMEWWSVKGGSREATWRTELNRIDESRRLLTALDVNPNNRYFHTMLTQADRRLLEVRDLQPNALGLAIAMDQPHARKIRTELERISACEVALAISDEDGSAVIREFQIAPRGRWLVAVRMVSEGVDIPPLRVLLWATNILSDLFFRQAIGRVVRRQANIPDEQAAFVYLPADNRLIAHAEKIKSERSHQLVEEQEKRTRDKWIDTDQPDMFVPMTATHEGRIGVVTDGETLPDADLVPIEAMAEEWGIPKRYAPNLLRMRRAEVRSAPIPRPGAPAADAPPLQDQKLKVGRLVERLGRRFAYEAGLEFEDVNKLLCRVTGQKKKDRTLAQLQHSMNVLTTWLTDLGRGVQRTLAEWQEVAERARASTR